jgi:hypothetical protein
MKPLLLTFVLLGTVPPAGDIKSADFDEKRPRIQATYREFWDRYEFSCGWPKKGYWSLGYSVKLLTLVRCRGKDDIREEVVEGGAGNQSKEWTKFPGYQVMQRHCKRFDRKGVDDPPLSCRRWYALEFYIQDMRGPRRATVLAVSAQSTPTYLDPDK